MRARHKVDNYDAQQAAGPDCSTCIHRKTCERYAENSFCGRWQSRQPEPEGTDPNEAWKRGDPFPGI